MNHRDRHDPLQRMNGDHGEDVLAVARALAGHPDATAARATAFDRAGVDLEIETPRGASGARVFFTEPIPEDSYPAGIRVAFVRLVRRARTVQSGN